MKKKCIFDEFVVELVLDHPQLISPRIPQDFYRLAIYFQPHVCMEVMELV